MTLFPLPDPGTDPHSPPEAFYQSSFKLLAKISKKIHSNTETAEILACIVESIVEVLSAKGCIHWILNDQKECIETQIFHGFDFQSLSRVNYASLMTIFDKNGTLPICISDARDDTRIPDLERLGKRKIRSVIGMFFDITGPYTGLLAVYFTGQRTLAAQELELLTALGEQGAIALEKAIGYDKKMKDMYQQIVEGFALAIEAKDKVTHGHSRRVARLSELTARKMGLEEKQVQQIFHAGILHDIGKIGTQNDLLERLGSLSDKEMAAIRHHPSLGADILRPLTFFCDIEPLVRHHHELFNGRGYPEGRKGDQIPLGARILTVCDAFETMMSGRPHIPKKDLTGALTALKKGVGTRFDPDVVQAFFEIVRENPDITDSPETIAACRDNLQQNLARLAAQNQIEKKLFNPFPGSF
ncbi:MAG: HD domain-containing protein [Proteobacteria bacterium]|nr:HD domain-containing protein [Desulfobacula sp.]MBU3952900.1 HD domain-containing protein [Pseudomonadota bacterium]MBU4133042.1 HD domain-containing protein [Pseudomonadota bacterium]